MIVPCRLPECDKGGRRGRLGEAGRRQEADVREFLRSGAGAARVDKYEYKRVDNLVQALTRRIKAMGVEGEVRAVRRNGHAYLVRVDAR